MATDIRHLGKTILQIERDERGVARPGADVHQERLREQLAMIRDGGSLLSSDECAIAVNDPNGCASWLRALADSIERGEHVGTTFVRVVLKAGTSLQVVHHPN